MKSKPIIRLFISIFMVINVILYPIGVTLTNPKVMNKILDTVNFEKIFLDSYKALVIKNVEQELPRGKDISEYDTIIDKAFISEDKLREQRVENVNGFYESLDKKETPKIVFRFENPLFTIKNNIDSLSDKLKDYIFNFGQSLDCENDSDSLKCKVAGNLGFGEKDDSDIDSESNVRDEVQEMMTLETSLGISEKNLNKVHIVYRILKYGPEALIVLTIVLMIIGYVLSYPDLKFARKLIFTFIKVDIVALAFWGLIPFIIRGFNPLKIVSSTDLFVGTSFNDSLADIFFEISKRAILMPLLFTLAAVGIYFLLMFMKKNQKSMENAMERAENKRENAKTEEVDTDSSDSIVDQNNLREGESVEGNFKESNSIVDENQSVKNNIKEKSGKKEPPKVYSES